MILVVLIHDPRHHAMVGSHVGRRNIRVRADHLMDLVDEFPRDPLQLVHAEFRDIDRNASFCPAVRDIHHGRLPRHERRQAPHLVQIDLRMVAHSTLHRAPRPIVLHPVADERPQ